MALKGQSPEKVADPQHKRRFVQEAKAASACIDPNIIHNCDIFSADAVDFIVMEHLSLFGSSTD